MYLKYLFIFIIITLSGCQTTQRIPNTNAGYGNYYDNDWNETFYDNAGLPSKNSIRWVKEGDDRYLRFKLKNKDIGKSENDDKRRSSAPYWERAELKQRLYFRKSSTYEINFKARFVEGFEGGRETFFQIHQWTRNCKVGPPIMLKFNMGELRLDAANYNLKTNKRLYAETSDIDYNINYFLNKWVNFKIIYSSLKNLITVYVNNKIIFNEIKFVPAPCGIPHIKFGIYRPGSIFDILKTSIVDFDEIQIKELKIP